MISATKYQKFWTKYKYLPGHHELENMQHNAGPDDESNPISSAMF